MKGKATTATTKGMGDVAHADQVVRMQHADLVSSPTNPRRHFAPGPLHDLASNLVSLARRALASGSDELGVQTPLFVRTDLRADGKREIIAGERRWRATALAMEMVHNEADGAALVQRLMWLPTLLKNWSDSEVVEFQLIENLQREDLTPIEECEGYHALVRRGYTVDQVAERVGKSASQVRKALTWVRLPKLAREAFEEGHLGREHAVLISRIPSEGERRLATVMVIENSNWRYDYGSWELDALEERARGVMGDEPVMTMRDLREMLASDFMRTLAGVKFALDDADLLPVECDEEGVRARGGSCMDCPYRTGCSPLYADELAEAGEGQGRKSGLDPNICTQPSCLQSKAALHYEREAQAASLKGVRTLSEEKCKKLFGSSSSLQYGVEYIVLDGKPDMQLTGHANQGKVKTWEKLLEGTGVEPELARDGEGSPRYVLPRAVAIMAVNQAYAEKGKETPLALAADQVASDEKWREQQQKAARDAKLEARAFELLLREVYVKTAADLPTLDRLARTAVKQAGMEGVRALCGGLGIVVPKPPKGESLTQGHYGQAIVETCIEGATKDSLCGMIAAAMIAVQCWQKLKSPELLDACKVLEISVTEAKAAARDEEKVKSGKKAKKKKDAPLLPGEAGDTTDRFDRTQSGAHVDDVPEDDESERVPLEEEAGDITDSVMHGVHINTLVSDAIKVAEQEMAARLSKLFGGDEDWQARWDALPQKPKKGSPELKAWDAERKRIKRGAAKAGVVLD